MRSPVSVPARSLRGPALRLVPATLALGLLGVPALAQSLGARSVREIRVPGRAAAARVWSEPGPNGEWIPHTAVSRDGRTFTEPRATDYDLRLRYGRFDPLSRSPQVPAALRARTESRLHIVQYWTRGLADYRATVEDFGGEILLFLPNHANVVELDAAGARAVERLPFVRAVTPFHPAYKLEGELLAAVAGHQQGELAVNLLTMRRGQQPAVADWIRSVGGEVSMVSERSFLMTATVPIDRLAVLAARDDVQWIDRWSPFADDMNLARKMHGSDGLEAVAGFTGTGVRVEVLDGGTVQDHPDMQDFIVHSPTMPTGSHGTCTSGIVLGKGLQNSKGRGAAPSAFLSMAWYGSFSGGNRYDHTAELVDPLEPYECVIQSNSFGSALTSQYTSISQDMDTMCFDLEHLSICQSQSNAGSTQSRPQAWAKNVISRRRHPSTTTPLDHEPTTRGRTVPPSAPPPTAASSRTWPAYFVRRRSTPTTTRRPGLRERRLLRRLRREQSAATPDRRRVSSALIVRDVERGDLPQHRARLDGVRERPEEHDRQGVADQHHQPVGLQRPGARPDSRTHQGWGHPQVRGLYNRRNNLLVIDETDVLEELDATTYDVEVVAGPEGVDLLRVTLVFRDPPGTTSASQHRINDLNLKVTSPSAVVYHGNAGLHSENYSLPGGLPNTLDTVENVFIEVPETGIWTIEVSAAEINQDAHLETGADDADYALVVSGIYIEEFGAPRAPTGLKGSTGLTVAVLSWTDVSDYEDGFTVEHSLDGVDWQVVGTTSADTTTFVHTGLAQDTENHYRVAGFNGYGDSASTAPIVLKTFEGDPQPLPFTPRKIRR